MWKYICSILVALCFCSGEDEIHFKQVGSAGIPKAGPLLQRVTTAAYQWTDGLFYDLETRYLYWVDRKGNSTVFCWYYETGTVLIHDFPEIRGEDLSFATPIENQTMGYILVSDLHIRKVTMKEDHTYTITEPLVTINELGYKVTQARSDCTGRLFIAIAYNDGSKGKLYKIENKEAIFVIEFKIAATSFAWNDDCTKMYILNNQMLDEYSYDKNNGQIDKKKMIYSLANIPFVCAQTKLIGINVDKRNDLWLGVEPYTVVINLKYPKWEFIQSVKLSNNPTTSYCFGGYKNKNLLFGTRKLSNPKADNLFTERGSIYGLSGLNITGVANYRVKWD